MSAPSKPLFDDPKGPPGASPRVRKLARRIVGPIEEFLAIEAASGIILLLAAAAALIWANSPWRETYHHLWETPVGLEVGTWSAKASLHFVVNDVLMAIFFLVVGLEIRREMHDGELSDLRRAALPVAAAIGGMLVPAGIYAAMNPSAPASSGWGVPMATDIAFAVGILALLGKRVPPALRVLLLALAIIDDIGAILVIAIFYSSGVEAQGFLIAGAGVAGILALQLLGVRLAPVYAFPAIALWTGILQAGVHPTIAGVISGLLTPATMWPGREDKAPVEYVQHALHPWVAFVIMPVFALANAGVDMSGVDLGASPMVALGIALGLLLGKPIGVLVASALCVKLGIAAMPRGVTWGGMVVVGTVAAIGFTMALFIAGLAFPSHPQLNEVAKLGILGASAVAAIATLMLGRVLLPERVDPAAAQTATEAESSTEA